MKNFVSFSLKQKSLKNAFKRPINRKNIIFLSSSSDSGAKLWGGRFSGGVDPLMEKFNASINVDKRMWREDLIGSKAYAKSLCSAGLLTQEEELKMQNGLDAVYKEWESNNFDIKPSDEDIHTANERRLTEIIGAAVAGKLHTGRSRNDQCVTDLRLWMKNANIDLQRAILSLLDSIHTKLSDPKEQDKIIAGYTHLQQAQPIRWAHYLLSYSAMLQRDFLKLQNSFHLVDISPLGSGALAGHSFFNPDERKSLSKELGFKGADVYTFFEDNLLSNSLDHISDRDFVVDFLYNTSLLGVHLSRLAEDLIIYSSAEFGFVKQSDLYATGSSLMPQKKNPDACEIVRGKAGSAVGRLVSMLTILKGLPMSYNKDLQDDKESAFAAFDTAMDCVQITEGVINTIEVMDQSKKLGADMFATDLADYLVRKKVPFRETHHVAGEAVQLAEDTGKLLSELSLEEFKSLHPLFEEDVKKIFDAKVSVEKKNAEGSTSLRSIQHQLKLLKAFINEHNS
eukprot:maker-scaffold_6-snap-gene-8.5-mRNA-1 protein AED:0.03 eAED:0.03 QI:85/0.83/0.85/1/0.83/0.71/7/247/509